MKSWGKNFGLKMLYIRLFRDLQKNILPESGRILELVKQPGQAGTKKDLACPGNSKSQIPNPKSQIPNSKLQTKKVEKKIWLFEKICG